MSSTAAARQLALDIYVGQHLHTNLLYIEFYCHAQVFNTEAEHDTCKLNKYEQIMLKHKPITFSLFICCLNVYKLIRLMCRAGLL